MCVRVYVAGIELTFRHRMFHDTRSVRGYWFPQERNDPHFLTMNTHRFAIRSGCDIPDLSPLYGDGTDISTCGVELDDGTKWKVYVVRQSQHAGPNRSVKPRHGAYLIGDVVVFREGLHKQQVVNMRAGDEVRALRAVKR